MLYPAAKVIVRHPDKKNMILLTQRSIGDKTYYEPAGGRIDADFSRGTIESFEACARREVNEELGVNVAIQNYIGNYYFFWRKSDTQKASVCIVFDGVITEVDQTFTTNKDLNEGHLIPAWVAMDDIANGTIIIDPMYVGLDELLKNYCKTHR